MSPSSPTPPHEENSPAPEFRGAARALSHNGLRAAAETLGISLADIWTVLNVETAGCGFLPDRRPQLLFERHIFHRLTGGKYDDGFISHPEPGGYGSRGSFQFERLARAVTLDRCTALQSASWGIGQILGMNYRLAGFKNIEEMVIAMITSE